MYISRESIVLEEQHFFSYWDVYWKKKNQLEKHLKANHVNLILAKIKPNVQPKMQGKKNFVLPLVMSDRGVLSLVLFGKKLLWDEDLDLLPWSGVFYSLSMTHLWMKLKNLWEYFVELATNHDWFTGSLVEQFCCEEKYEICILSKKIDENQNGRNFNLILIWFTPWFVQHIPTPNLYSTCIRWGYWN